MKFKLNPILREEMKRYAGSRRFYVWQRMSCFFWLFQGPAMGSHSGTAGIM